MTNPIDKAALRALAEAADDRPYNADATTAFRAAVTPHKVLAMLDEWERTERNRDMWKEQVATQAAQIEACRAEAARYQLLRLGRYWSVINGIGDELRGEALDAAVAAALIKMENPQ